MGRIEAAADEFHRLSMPYDAALALVDSGDSAHAARRHSTFSTSCGTNTVPRRCVVTCAHEAFPRCPRAGVPRRWPNPAGLTARRRGFGLLDDGLTNAELAERLSWWPRPSITSVSAILTKLDVTKRRDAVRRGRELGLLT